MFFPDVLVLLEVGAELHPHEKEVDEVAQDPNDDGHLHLSYRRIHSSSLGSRE